MKAHSRELLEWIKNGAYLYVCGDKQNMAKDVHLAILDIIAKENRTTRETAEAYLNSMQEQGRYQRDVY